MLYDEGATIQHNLTATQAKSVDIDPQSYVHDDVTTNGLIGVPAGDHANELCGAVSGQDLTVENGLPIAPTEVGCADEGGNTVAHEFTVESNTGVVSVIKNIVSDNLLVQDNTLGAATVTSNSSKRAPVCRNNVPLAGAATSRCLATRGRTATSA